jgi:glycosyltransferase
MKISVITATYNSAATVRHALQSVSDQSWPDVEHIVIDGASRDDTLAILAQHGARVAKVVSEPDKGIFDALNKGIAAASGDVVGFLHSDDEFASPEVLSWIAQEFSDENVQAVYGDLVYVRRENTQSVVRTWRSGKFSPGKLARGWMPPHPTLYLRRGIYERLGVFDCRYRIAADYDFILRLFSSAALGVRYIPRVLVRMRVGGNSNRSLRNILNKSREDYAALRSHGFGAAALAAKNLRKLPQFLAR